MKANELRIGNWISHTPSQNKSADGNFIVSQINLFDSNTINGLESDDCEPIPLTEEWLYKFGFKDIDKGDHDYNTYTDSNHDYYLQIDVRKKDGKYSILDNSFDDLRDFSMVDISYVHQLQNLYFALTGEELIYYLNMNKERYNQIIDKAYKNYWDTYPNAEKTFQYEGSTFETRRMTKDEFIDMIKTDPEFSKKWGLKIEERELSDKERLNYAMDILGIYQSVKDGELVGTREEHFTKYNIPTRLITITYNNESIESYE